MPKATLEQWRMLKAVVEAGGFAKAAEMVHKSPSSINHAVQKLQTQLGIPLLEVRGRKAELTPAGETLLRRAGHLLDEARDMEGLAQALAAGVESEVVLAVDQWVPQMLIMDALGRFAQDYPTTRVQYREALREEGADLLRGRLVDLFVGPSVPSGVLAQPLGQIRLLCVASAQHPLARYSGTLSMRDLRPHRHVIMWESPERQDQQHNWLEPERQWGVGHVATALNIVRSGLAYAWLPECLVREDLDRGVLRALDLEAGATQAVTFSLAYADRDRAGAATHALAQAVSAAFADRQPEPETMPDWWSMARCGPAAGL